MTANHESLVTYRLRTTPLVISFEIIMRILWCQIKWYTQYKILTIKFEKMNLPKVFSFNFISSSTSSLHISVFILMLATFHISSRLRDPLLQQANAVNVPLRKKCTSVIKKRIHLQIILGKKNQWFKHLSVSVYWHSKYLP